METVKLEDIKVGKISYGRYAEIKRRLVTLQEGEALKLEPLDGEDPQVFGQKLRTSCRQGRAPQFSVCVRVDRVGNVIYIWRKA